MKNEKIQKLASSSLDLVLNTSIKNILSTPTLSQLFDEAFGISNIEHSDDLFIEWPECKDEEQPFLFALTFPNQTYATEGDIVSATLHLLSNLSTSVKVNHLSVSSPFNSNLVKFELQNDFPWILIPGIIKQIPVKVILQSNLSTFVDTKLSELQSIKGEKTKTAGLTSIGGGIYSDTKERKKISKGGLSVGCTALKIKISSPKVKNASSVTLNISNLHHGTSPYRLNTKRITTEVDNYVYSAWSRPTVLPLSSGPRCLRVVCPQPNFEIIDLTTSSTNGRLMEGTVNRIMLKLRAGHLEDCRNVKLSVVCSSILEDDPSKSSSLLDKEQQSSEDVNQLGSRQPLILEQGKFDATKSRPSIPLGWKANSFNNGQGARDNWIHIEDVLNMGSSTYAHFDLFRPLPEYDYKTTKRCRTNFLVTVSYKQVRSSQCEASRGGDLVVQEYRGSAVWCPPMTASISFCPATKKLIPSGMRHVGNVVSIEKSHVPVQDSIAIKSGSIAFMKCTIEAAEAANHLEVQLKSVKFEVSKDEF